MKNYAYKIDNKVASIEKNYYCTIKMLIFLIVRKEIYINVPLTVQLHTPSQFIPVRRQVEVLQVLREETGVPLQNNRKKCNRILYHLYMYLVFRIY